MSTRTRGLLLITISLVAAAAMLGVAALLDGADSAQTVTFVIIAIWFVPFLWLSNGARKGAKGADKDQLDP